MLQHCAHLQQVSFSVAVMDAGTSDPHYALCGVFATVGFLLAHHHAPSTPPRRTRISVGPRNISAALAVRAILATKASLYGAAGGPFWGCTLFAVVGKSSDVVVPVTYTLPAVSTAMPYAKSSPCPPRCTPVRSVRYSVDGTIEQRQLHRKGV